MGVDYTPVAGFTINLNDVARKQISVVAKEKAGDKYADWESDFDILGILYSTVGSCYTGDTESIPIFIPKDAVNLDAQVESWLSDFNTKCKTNFQTSDIIFTRDLFIW